MKSLQQLFHELAKEYTSDLSLIDKFWTEIEVAHSHKKRHYHTLSHLENLYLQLTNCKEFISDWNVILFTLFYHDIVYKASKSDNEEKSAELAEMRLKSLGVPAEQIEKCKIQILATKSHQMGNELDTNLFTDADLSILGFSWENYRKYFQQVRKEYSIYPDLLYKPGRKKVLQHFLAMERIFKTDFFFKKYESQARINLQKEIDLL